MDGSITRRGQPCWYKMPKVMHGPEASAYHVPYGVCRYSSFMGYAPTELQQPELHGTRAKEWLISCLMTGSLICGSLVEAGQGSKLASWLLLHLLEKRQGLGKSSDPRAAAGAWHTLKACISWCICIDAMKHEAVAVWARLHPVLAILPFPGYVFYGCMRGS